MQHRRNSLRKEAIDQDISSNASEQWPGQQHMCKSTTHHARQYYFYSESYSFDMQTFVATKEEIIKYLFFNIKFFVANHCNAFSMQQQIDTF